MLAYSLMSNEWTDQKKYVDVLAGRMAYVELGEGDPIVFLHGNPTSSFLWRNIAPLVAEKGRCIVPDLIGMGDSSKLRDSGPDGYRFVEHQDYLEVLLALLGATERVVLVGHDWGGALGFNWAIRNRESVRGLVYMETMVRPVSWSDWPEPARKIFQAMRSEAGEEMVLTKNVFVERILPASVLNPLSEEVMAEYRRPFLEAGESRRPTLTWPRQIPIDRDPRDVAKIVERYGEWLESSPVPKLFINAHPGSILVGPQRDYCRTWPNQTEVTVPGSHFIQEDSPTQIAEAINGWLEDLD